MKQNSRYFINGAAHAVATATFLATIAFGSCSAMANNDAKGMSQDRVEARIANLHASLKITPAQEDLWAKVADAMRDDAKTMNDLTQKRANNAKTMSAVEDLKSYGDIVQAHADAIRKFSSAFDPLYADMSDTQKKTADEFFRHGNKHTGKMKMSRTS